MNTENISIICRYSSNKVYKQDSIKMIINLLLNIIISVVIVSQINGLPLSKVCIFIFHKLDDVFFFLFLLKNKIFKQKPYENREYRQIC
jgi:hypothetical protein